LTMNHVQQSASHCYTIFNMWQHKQQQQQQQLGTTTINQHDVKTMARTNNTSWHDDDNDNNNNNEPKIISTTFILLQNLGFCVSLLLYSSPRLFRGVRQFGIMMMTTTLFVSTSQTTKRTTFVLTLDGLLIFTRQFTSYASLFMLFGFLSLLSHSLLFFSWWRCAASHLLLFHLGQQTNREPSKISKAHKIRKKLTPRVAQLSKQTTVLLLISFK
jgi:hypothetical protein